MSNITTLSALKDLEMRVQEGWDLTFGTQQMETGEQQWLLTVARPGQDWHVEDPLGAGPFRTLGDAVRWAVHHINREMRGAEVDHIEKGRD